MIVRERKTFDAQRWFRNGDHSDDNCQVVKSSLDGRQFWTEGSVVRYYRNPRVEGRSECIHCHNQMHIHGWLDTGGEGQAVCPGDWIIREGVDKYHAVPLGAFELMYEETQ